MDEYNIDVRSVTSDIRMKQWADIINDRINSGLKVDDYCNQHNISRHKYYYWLHKIRLAAIEDCNHTLVELSPKQLPAVQNKQLPVRAESSDVTTYIPRLILEVNGITIKVSPSTSKELLMMACEVAANVK